MTKTTNHAMQLTGSARHPPFMTSPIGLRDLRPTKGGSVPENLEMTSTLQHLEETPTPPEFGRDVTPNAEQGTAPNARGRPGYGIFRNFNPNLSGLVRPRHGRW